MRELPPKRQPDESVRRLILNHFVDALLLLVTDAALLLAVYCIGLIPHIPPDFVRHTDAALVWIGVAILCYLAGDLALQLVFARLLRWLPWKFQRSDKDL